MALLRSESEQYDQKSPETITYLNKFTSRKMKESLEQEIAQIPDSFLAWITRYLHMVVVGVRSEEVTALLYRRMVPLARSASRSSSSQRGRDSSGEGDIRAVIAMFFHLFLFFRLFFWRSMAIFA